MRVTVESRVHRILRHAPQFKKCRQWTEIPNLKSKPSPLNKTETLLGVFENTPGSIDELIVITTESLYWRQKNDWEVARYSDIEKVLWPELPKDKAQSLSICMNNGTVKEMPARDGYWSSFTRFIDRVCDDLDPGWYARKTL